MRYYTCCAGSMPCSGRCGESNCPEVCLATETTCCFANSVVSTRYMLQDSMIIQNTQCDDVLVGILIALEQLACIFRCAGDITGNRALEEAGGILTVAADLTYCSVCGCMQCASLRATAGTCGAAWTDSRLQRVQHKLQLDALEEGRYSAPAFMPPAQQTMDGGYGSTPQQGMYA